MVVVVGGGAGCTLLPYFRLIYSIFFIEILFDQIHIEFLQIFIIFKDQKIYILTHVGFNYIFDKLFGFIMVK